ncbi:MAG: alpha-hydroxy-acid oxidizing protein [Bacillota bacterium]|uniref:L-lactate oxidase n=1 Tax=Thermanaerosceptrum fracticalcis TaxID=1712410 RepID=A0A7G6DZ30_THEFR|nr:alpha-hydroxy-acid oxidizing protein [Thermanaerosceptrum fracticalcis]QNB45084.1 alpha-hydroxy-acid oxidizing protein [Thermanaerosceptrum fracticalcis]
MNLAEVRAKAKEKLAGICQVCRVCDGRACAGQVPGVGGIGTGSSFKRNVEALANCFLNLRTMHDVADPSLTWDFFGNTLRMPVLGAAIGGGKLNYKGVISDEELADAFINGCHQAGIIGQIGDGPDLSIFRYGLEKINTLNGWGIPIIKPREQEEIIKRIKMAEEAGCKAVGIDIDAAGLINMRAAGQKVEPKTLAQLQEITKATKLPVILKGVMTPEEAEKAVQAGAKAIVVSNHGGRVLDWTLGTAEVLPGIAYMVKGKITILMDGGIRNGWDVLKALALGADAVMMGRPLAIGAVGAGALGVKLALDQVYNELYVAMIMTGTTSVHDVHFDILREKRGRGFVD